MIFQTQRLVLREMDIKDYQDLVQFLQDREVMYAYGHDFTDQDVIDWIVRQQKRYREYGFGLWAVILKETGELIGDAGISIQECEGQQIPEIGYHLKKKFWHRGFAREAALGCRDYAFQVLKVPKVYSIIKEDNLPSKKVARAVGMKEEKCFLAKYYAGEMPHVLFSVDNPHKEMRGLADEKEEKEV